MTVQRLLSLGIPGRNIALVKPPGNVTSLAVCDDGCEGDPFNEPAVTDAVMTNLRNAGVEILIDYVLVNWNSESTADGEFSSDLDFCIHYFDRSRGKLPGSWNIMTSD